MKPGVVNPSKRMALICMLSIRKRGSCPESDDKPSGNASHGMLTEVRHEEPSREFRC